MHQAGAAHRPIQPQQFQNGFARRRRGAANRQIDEIKTEQSRRFAGKRVGSVARQAAQIDNGFDPVIAHEAAQIAGRRVVGAVQHAGNDCVKIRPNRAQGGVIVEQRIQPGSPASGG